MKVQILDRKVWLMTIAAIFFAAFCLTTFHASAATETDSEKKDRIKAQKELEEQMEQNLNYRKEQAALAMQTALLRVQAQEAQYQAYFKSIQDAKIANYNSMEENVKAFLESHSNRWNNFTNTLANQPYAFHAISQGLTGDLGESRLYSNERLLFMNSTALISRTIPSVVINRQTEVINPQWPILTNLNSLGLENIR